jgi:hypothetical protein
LPGVVDIVIEPRLLKFDPGLALPSRRRKPEVVVVAKVELLNVKPKKVELVTGVQPAPKHPSVEPAMNTSSALAVR